MGYWVRWSPKSGHRLGKLSYAMDEELNQNMKLE
jgi:hypothetical protein